MITCSYCGIVIARDDSFASRVIDGVEEGKYYHIPCYEKVEEAEEQEAEEQEVEDESLEWAADDGSYGTAKWS